MHQSAEGKDNWGAVCKYTFPGTQWKHSGKQAPTLDEKEIHLLTLDHLSNGKGIVGILPRIRGTGESHLFFSSIQHDCTGKSMIQAF